MSARSTLIGLVILAVVSFAAAKNKQVLPNYVVQAQTVAVVIQPDAGEPVANPTANRTAEENVEKALSEWGRYRLVTDAEFADLVIAVRKGHAGGPTIANSPTDNRPVTIQSAGATTGVGVQQGCPSDLTYPLPGEPAGPRPGNEIGGTEDSIEVYQGRVQYPLMQLRSDATGRRAPSTHLNCAPSKNSARPSPSRKRHTSKNREHLKARRMHPIALDTAGNNQLRFGSPVRARPSLKVFRA